MTKVYVLVLSNDLSVPSIKNDLIFLFIIRKAGLVVKKKSEIHAVDPSVEDNIIYYPNFEICMHFSLYDVF